MDKSNENSKSLNKYISETGICSRREADKLIKEGHVKINGKTAKLGNRVFQGDTVTLRGEQIGFKPDPVYLIFNKPPGIVCTTDLREPNNIIDYIGYPERLFPIGRLDKMSDGLIFLTNDGDIVNKILRAGNRHEKEYIVSVDKRLTDQFLKKMASGVEILGTVTKKCQVERISDFTFKIVLVQGLNRQIRRMCETLGYNVTQLTRVRIMDIKMARLKTGHCRQFTKAERRSVFEAVKTSSKTE